MFDDNDSAAVEMDFEPADFEPAANAASVGLGFGMSGTLVLAKRLCNPPYVPLHV